MLFILLGILFAETAASQQREKRLDLDQPSPPRPACYYDGAAFSVGAVMFRPLPAGCSREANRLLRSAETMQCVVGDDGRAFWLPLIELDLRQVSEEIGAGCER